MSLSWIKKAYNVPAKRGARVEYTGDGSSKLGTIRGARGAYIRIRLDGEKRLGLYHPTWELRYLDSTPPHHEGA